MHRTRFTSSALRQGEGDILARNVRRAPLRLEREGYVGDIKPAQSGASRRVRLNQPDRSSRFLLQRWETVRVFRPSPDSTAL